MIDDFRLTILDCVIGVKSKIQNPKSKIKKSRNKNQFTIYDFRLCDWGKIQNPKIKKSRNKKSIYDLQFTIDDFRFTILDCVIWVKSKIQNKEIKKSKIKKSRNQKIKKSKIVVQIDYFNSTK